MVLGKLPVPGRPTIGITVGLLFIFSTDYSLLNAFSVLSFISLSST